MRALIRLPTAPPGRGGGYLRPPSRPHCPCPSDLTLSLPDPSQQALILLLSPSAGAGDSRLPHARPPPQRHDLVSLIYLGLLDLSFYHAPVYPGSQCILWLRCN